MQVDALHVEHGKLWNTLTNACFSFLPYFHLFKPKGLGFGCKIISGNVWTMSGYFSERPLEGADTLVMRAAAVWTGAEDTLLSRRMCVKS